MDLAWHLGRIPCCHDSADRRTRAVRRTAMATDAPCPPTPRQGPGPPPGPTPAAVCPLPPQKPRLLDRVRESIRDRHTAPDREGLRRLGQALHLLPREAAPRPDGRARGPGLPDEPRHSREVSASTQNQAFSALLFLYREVLEHELRRPRDVPSAPKRPPAPRGPTRGTRSQRSSTHLDGIPRLMASPDVRRRPAPARMLPPARERPRLRAQARSPSGRKGAEGPPDAAPGGLVPRCGPT